MRSTRLVCLMMVVAIAAHAGDGEETDPASSGDEFPQVTRQYDMESERLRFDSLLEEFGANKELPAGYELQALIALSHFPELRDINVRFVQDDVGIPISSRPRPISTFRSRNNRLYLVVIDTESEERGALLLKNQPFNAQIGILGHELAHTVWYIDRSFFGIVSDAFCQLSNNCRVQFERDTDRRLVYHGLGWQRYDHSSFVRAGFRREGVESDGGGGAYMDPPELLAVMEESKIYDLTQVAEQTTE
jgi:hypothetical protein